MCKCEGLAVEASLLSLLKSGTAWLISRFATDYGELEQSAQSKPLGMMWRRAWQMSWKLGLLPLLTIAEGSQGDSCLCAIAGIWT